MPIRLPELPVSASIKRTTRVTRKTLEFDPNKIKAGEAVVVEVSRWGGLSNQKFVVMNIEGKKIRIQQLRTKETRTTNRIADKMKSNR